MFYKILYYIIITFRLFA